MRRILTAASIAALASGTPVTATDLALTVMEGVHVVHPHTGLIDYDRTVVVRDGRIAAVAPSDGLAPPTGATVLELNGRFVMPGLAEMHAHVPAERQGREVLEETLFLWVANGITTARGMLGERSHLALREALLDPGMTGPRLITSGPSFNGNSVSSPEQATEMARYQAYTGYDFLKLHPGLSRDEFDAIASASADLGIPIGGHVSDEVGLDRTLEVGQAAIDHLDAYLPALSDDPVITPDNPYGFFGLPFALSADESRIEALAIATARAGVWNVPTQSLIEQVLLPGRDAALRNMDELRYVSPLTRTGWQTARNGFVRSPGYDPDAATRFVEIRRRLIGALHQAGAGLLLGSDSPQIFNVPGFSIHTELATLVASGLTPAEALTTGTLNPARFFGLEQEFGKIATGLSADMIVTSINPLESLDTLRRPVGVFVRGRYLDRAYLDEQLSRIADRHAQ